MQDNNKDKRARVRAIARLGSGRRVAVATCTRTHMRMHMIASGWRGLELDMAAEFELRSSAGWARRYQPAPAVRKRNEKYGGACSSSNEKPAEAVRCDADAGGDVDARSETRGE
jgi:hypothetical protein